MALKEINSHLDGIEEVLKEIVEDLKDKPEVKNKKEQFELLTTV